MSWFRSLRRAAAPTPSADHVASRRRLFAGTAGAILGSTLLADDVWARAKANGIEPGTLVDAQGNRLDRAPMSADPMLAEIMMFAGNFAPRGWALCDGQLLPISQNTALFSLIGTLYGGDGRTTFGLPDLRGRFPMHGGNGPGLTPHSLGQKGGTETVTLTTAQMPSHSHQTTLPHALVRGTGDPVTGVTTGGQVMTTDAPPVAAAVTTTTSHTGGNAPQTNMPPFLTINFCIALQGTYPSRY